MASHCVPYIIISFNLHNNVRDTYYYLFFAQRNYLLNNLAIDEEEGKRVTSWLKHYKPTHLEVMSFFNKCDIVVSAYVCFPKPASMKWVGLCVRTRY